MIRKPLIVTFRLDKDTRAKVLGRIGPNHRLRTFSQLVREGIELRLAPERVNDFETPGVMRLASERFD
jgi:hypothetical protein